MQNYIKVFADAIIQLTECGYTCTSNIENMRNLKLH